MRAASRITRRPKLPAPTLRLHNISADAYELLAELGTVAGLSLVYQDGELEVSGPDIEASDVSTLVLREVSWEVYNRLSDALGEGHVRLTYDEGTLELMAPSFNHEWWKRRLDTVVRQLLLELGINFQGGGSTTFKRKALRKGVEPDECFYIKNVEKVRGKHELDMRKDPPPDLVLEVDVTSSSQRRMGIYAQLGVAEVWVYASAELSLYRLGANKRYRRVKKSGVLPVLPVAEFNRFLCDTQELTEFELIHAFRQWIQQHLPPESLKD